MTFSLRSPYDKVIVKPFPKETITEGAILIPEMAQERQAKATVMAVGKGTKDRPMVFEPGDIAFHVKDCGSPIMHEGEEYFIIRDSDILAYIRN